jgi:uridine phosphorylase
VALAQAAADLGFDHHVGTVASVDTFYEGQERSASSANPHLIRRLRGMIDEYADLGVLSFEMEAGTLLKMGGVYGFAAGCVVGIVAQRTEDERPDLAEKDAAVDRALRTAIAAADAWSSRRS